MSKKRTEMKQDSSPLISVVIPCYNQAVYLPETLNSLISQTYTRWEGIIVNDGSPDDTEEVALLYVDKDSRFKYIHKKNGGLSSARNLGIANASGEYILPLDSDDIIQPEYLNKAVEAFVENSTLDVVYCQEYCFGAISKMWDLPPYQGYEALLLNNAFFCSAVFRKSDCLQVGGYDEQMLQGYEDWEFFIRLLNKDSQVYQIPEPLFHYRIKEVSMLTSSSRLDIRLKLEDYIYQKHADKYSSCFGGVLNVHRELVASQARIKRYDNKWYRCLFHKYIKNKFSRKSR